jgi:hypothetical protein
MSQCSYWYCSDDQQWCDLAANICNCSGITSKCIMGGENVAGAFREAEKLAERGLDFRSKRRKFSHSA